MRAFLPNYDIVTPTRLSEALNLLEQHSGTLQPLAGGTDLMVTLDAGTLPAGTYLNLWELDELRHIQVEDNLISIGALCTYSDITAHEELRIEFPMLIDAARQTGAVAIQNRGTLGGNIMNASPAADSPPALLAYDATVELKTSKGSRRLNYSTFHTGYKQTQRHPTELLTTIVLPRRTEPTHRHYYRKVGTRNAQAISKICFAAWADYEAGVVRDLRIGLGSVAPTPIRALAAERAVRGHAPVPARIDGAAKALLTDIAPIDDIRSTAAYRSAVATNLLRDFLQSL